MADWGLKVSQDGAGVGTADVQQLSFTSQYFLLKVHAQGSTSLTVTSTGTAQTGTIPHNLGYVPAYIVWASVRDSTYRYTTPAFPVTVVEPTWARIDGTNLIVGGVSNSGTTSYTANYYYYIFKDRAF